MSKQASDDDLKAIITSNVPINPELYVPLLTELQKLRKKPVVNVEQPVPVAAPVLQPQVVITRNVCPECEAMRKAEPTHVEDALPTPGVDVGQSIAATPRSMIVNGRRYFVN